MQILKPIPTGAANYKVKEPRNLTTQKDSGRFGGQLSAAKNYHRTLVEKR